MQSRIELIYEEAARLFAHNGFEGTSLRDVANACGISMAAIHYHFATKEELHNEITQFCFEEFIERIAVQQGKLPPARNTPSALLVSIFDAIMADPTLFNLMQHDMQHLDDDRRRARARTRYNAFVVLIEAAMTRVWGKRPDEPAVLCAMGLVAGYCEVLQADERSTGEQREAFVASHRQTLLRVVERVFDQPGQY